MNIKTKNEAVGKFEQALVDMLNKVYGDSKNVKIDSAPVSGGTMYIVGDSWNEVDFLVLKDETGKDMNYPALTIYINGEETKKHHGKNGMTLKTFYGLHDADPDMLRTCQQILQKYIDGVNLNLSWLRFEESKESEAKRNYYGYGKDEPIDKEDNDFMFQVAYDWFEKKLPRKLKDYADNAVNKVIDKDMRSYEEIETMDDYYDYLEKYGSDIVEEIKNDHADESKKSEADYSTSRVSKSIADAYKVLDDYYCDNDGSLRKGFVNQIMTTFVNDRDLYTRSQSKAVKSHSLAWDVLCRQINAHLEWDDETPHATKLTSEQVKNWFKLKGRDFKEDLKPLVDAIDAYRNKKESKGESMKNEANIEDLRNKSISHGTMRSEHLIPEFLGVLKIYAPEKYDAYVKANPEVLDLDGLDDETLGYIVEELFDALNDIAPEGTYFGAHPGDGSDYGFWEVEPDESKNKKTTEANTHSYVFFGPNYDNINSTEKGSLYDTVVRALDSYGNINWATEVDDMELNDLDHSMTAKLTRELNPIQQKVINNVLAQKGIEFGYIDDNGKVKGYSESKCGDGKDDKGKKPEESAKPVKNILRRRFEVLTKSVLHACDKLVKDASLAGEFDDEVIYAEDAVKNAIESFNAMGDAIVRLKTVLESHKNEDNMEIIGILSDAITKIVADEQGDETDAATAGADSVIDQVEREYGNEPENEPEANGEENEAPNPAGAEAPDEF